MGKHENKVSDDLALYATGAGGRLFRNNTGVCRHDDGSFVRYGVGGNGGSDLIGFTRMTVTPEMVGRTVAVFTAVEVKSPGEKPTKDQGKFLSMVNDKGGIGVWGTSCSEVFERIFARLR